MDHGSSDGRRSKGLPPKPSLCEPGATQDTPRYRTRTNKTSLLQQHREMCVVMKDCRTPRCTRTPLPSPRCGCGTKPYGRARICCIERVGGALLPSPVFDMGQACWGMSV